MSYPPEFIQFCARINNKLTSLRKSILYILWNSGKPLKAYEILEQLLQTKYNSKPPTVYRVLDYFVAAGLVHKIESIQSYTLCQTLQKHYQSELLMVCNNCHQVQEIYDQVLHDLLERLSTHQGFNLSADAIELKGLCAACKKNNDHPLILLD